MPHQRNEVKQHYGMKHGNQWKKYLAGQQVPSSATNQVLRPYIQHNINVERHELQQLYFKNWPNFPDPAEPAVQAIKARFQAERRELSAAAPHQLQVVEAEQTLVREMERLRLGRFFHGIARRFRNVPSRSNNRQQRSNTGSTSVSNRRHGRGMAHNGSGVRGFRRRATDMSGMSQGGMSIGSGGAFSSIVRTSTHGTLGNSVLGSGNVNGPEGHGLGRWATDIAQNEEITNLIDSIVQSRPLRNVRSRRNTGS